LLSTNERRHLNKMGGKSETFCRRTLVAMCGRGRSAARHDADRRGAHAHRQADQAAGPRWRLRHGLGQAMPWSPPWRATPCWRCWARVLAWTPGAVHRPCEHRWGFSEPMKAVYVIW